MKSQPTITYIKNGKEKTIRINKLNKTYIKKTIFKEYISNELIVNENISLVHFKNMVFEVNAIKCRNNNIICIFEDCTFKKSPRRNNLELQMGSFEFINPNLINIHQINAKYLRDFVLIITDRDLCEKMEFSIDISADNINLQGDFLLENLLLEGKNINLGNDKISTNITLLDYGWYQSIIKGKQLNIKNCLIKNISQKLLTIESPNLNIDENSCIKTNGDALINSTYYLSNIKRTSIITKKDIVRTSLISQLKTYNVLLKQKIQKNTNFHLEKELFSLNKQIEIQENILKELEEKLHNEHSRKNKAIIKSLSKKPISYFQNK